MKLLKGLGVFVLASSLVTGPTAAWAADSDAKSSASEASTVANELAKLREALAEQQKQIAQQQREIEALRRQMSEKQDASAQSEEQQPRVIDAAMHTSSNPGRASEAAAYGGRAQTQEKPKESPLSVRIGGAEFTPGGFADFTAFFRTTNLGSGIGTSFGALPFNNQIQGHLSEVRLTSQTSRLSLKVTGKYGENDMTGFMEMDWLGNDAANAFVVTNSHTNRIRHYWLDLKRGKWEILGGQTWSWLTPNRVGVSAMSSDVFTTQNVDPLFHVGLSLTRAAQFRLIYHPNEKWALGVAVENPQQYVAAGEVIYPFLFNAQLGPQLDAANNTATPNLTPDFIPKVTYDTNFSGRHLHAEVAGLLTTVKTNIVSTQGLNGVWRPHTKVGGGVSAAVNVELVKNYRVVANGFYSDGGGRYLLGLGPDTVMVPVVYGTSYEAIPSLVHSGAGLVGFEAQVTPKTLLAGYYGGVYFQRNAFIDITSPLLIKPMIGFGGTNSPNSANRAIQEGTLDLTQTFWKNPQYGALQLVTQFSYLTRSPWFVAAGAPKNAHLFEGYVSLRYLLP
ncbi:MAG: hypothetical protein LAN84_06555 [Acidobacteriia bacterium]|nr:hypothetical protein [Terriglobia bacterium]